MVSLPNIIANKIIVPEIIENKVSVNNIVYEIEKLLFDKGYREDNIKQLGEVKALLSEKISSVEVANEIARELDL